MGQKVNPKGMRIGITQGWDSQWYASKGDYKKLLHEDLAIEALIRKKTEAEGGISKIEIMRTQGKVIININTSKPGILIGKGGETIEKLKDALTKEFNKTFAINVKEIKKPMQDSYIVAESIAKQVERRISYRRAAKVSLEKIMESGAQGAKIYLGGRLNGVEISRGEFFSEGKIPLHTFRANIDYASIPANTSYGKIGIKVWIYKGDVFKQDRDAKLAQEIEEIKQA